MKTAATDKSVLPCPFCGRQPRYRLIEFREELRLTTHYIQCKRCPVRPQAWGTTYKVCVRRWNRRSPN